MSVVLQLWGPPGAASAAALRSTEDKARSVAALARGEDLTLLEYVESCDVDARGGLGDIRLTRDLARAKRFADFSEAMAYWKRQSRVRPLRPDGKPNRPLTAYNVTPVTVP